jgi:hypothetical protein
MAIDFTTLLEDKAISSSIPSAVPAIWLRLERKGTVPMVAIPEALALDLIRYLSPYTFGAEASWEDCEAGLHDRRAEAHLARMRSLEGLIATGLLDQNTDPSGENMLRMLTQAYEAAAVIGKEGVA